MSAAPLKAQLAGSFGRAIVTTRTHHLVVDSPPLFNGPNEAINPVELLLGSLATCGIFVCEAVAKEKGYGLTGGSAQVSGAMKADPPNMGLQTVTVKLDLVGVTEAEAADLVDAFRSRCPVYATLSKAAPIEFEVSVS